MFQTITAADVKPRALRWLLRDRLPLGAVSLLVGDGGLGKSTYMIEMAARLSRGELDGDLQGTPCASYILSTEDDAETTLTPRLIAADAQRDLVHLPADGDGSGIAMLPTLPDDTAELTETLVSLGVRLLVFDPLTAFLSEKIDSWKDQRVRRAMAPLAKLAHDADCAVVGIMHINRRETASTSARISGSPAFRNAARSVLVFGPDPTDDKRRIVAQEKANLARPDVPSELCRIEDARVMVDGQPIETSRIVMLGDSDATAQDILVPEPGSAARPVDAWLEQVLRDGPRKQSDIDAMAAEFNFTPKMLRTARQRLGVQLQRGGFGAEGWSEWSLPDQPDF